MQTLSDRRALIGPDAQWHEVFAHTLRPATRAMDCEALAVQIRQERAREIAAELMVMAAAIANSKEQMLSVKYCTGLLQGFAYRIKAEV